ncbi:hypothetical protein [Leptospirillum ferriphilum]|uniref:hypothetical protein n=1 Tax=Leptospirillum ferriphilum TaxID=178606 RepID=UPI0006B21EB3|nr:hypothetical protein [Leptospirillum ferriphilum]
MNVLISRRVKYTGKIFEPGTILDLPEDKAWRLINQCWAEPVQDYENTESESLNSSRLFSQGKPTGGTLDDPPLIRVYAWSLVNLRFGPILSTPTDFPRAAEECRLSIEETREAFKKLVRDGDLRFEREQGREYYWLAPIRW